jgi:two-component system OmpR family response regulator
MRILLVEDEKKVAGFVSRGLRAESYAVDVANDGREGSEHIQAFSYDLIVLDLNLPAFSGTELLRQVRKRDREVPVLILRPAIASTTSWRILRRVPTIISLSPFRLPSCWCGSRRFSGEGTPHHPACCAWRISPLTAPCTGSRREIAPSISPPGNLPCSNISCSVRAAFCPGP